MGAGENELAAAMPGRDDRLMERPREILTHGPVTLRRWRTADAEKLYLAVAESLDHLRPWMPWAVDYQPASAAEFLRQCEQDWESGDAFNYAISVPGSEVAGSCGLMARIGPGGLEIGYWVHVGHIRRGLATAAAAALAAEAFTLPGIDRVEIVHDEENVASGRIPRKLGFTEIERRPQPPDRPAGADDAIAGAGEVIDIVWRLTR
jgi:ribosomal-protein-serine acetyltransferase